MLPTELEEQINELESRVDRLRALYEQYFMGIEKMEPQVARKDVDRRIVTIRREQIRNTALRYRFHMILQRYNTFQSYWMRICREIEEGTYKRHLIRAGKKFGEVAATRALPKWHRRRFAKKKSDGTAEDGVEEIDMAEAVETESAPAAKKSTPPIGMGATGAGATGAVKKPPPPPLPARASPPKPATLPGAAAAGAAAAAPHASAPSLPNASEVRATDGEASKDDRMRELARRLNEKRAAVAATPGAAPTPAASPAPRPVPTPAAAAPKSAPLAPAAPAAAAPVAPAPAAPAPAARAPAPAASPAPSGGRDLSEERMRQLYSELVETKRKQKESTAAVTYEALAKSLRESSAKLKEKHGGRSVDFEVTVKDGKTILRPVVK